MRISNNASNLAMYLTKEERALISTSRVEVTFHLKSEKEFLRLHPTSDPHLGYSIGTDKGIHPFRIQVTKTGRPSQIPIFGTETIECRQVSGGVVVVNRPLMNALPTTRNTKSRASKPPVLAVNGTTSLSDSIKAVNKYKDDLREQLILEIDSNGYLKAMVEYGR